MPACLATLMSSRPRADLFTGSEDFELSPESRSGSRGQTRQEQQQQVSKEVQQQSWPPGAAPDWQSDAEAPAPPPAPLNETPVSNAECNLFVGDLARGLTEEDLLIAFREHGRCVCAFRWLTILLGFYLLHHR